MMIYSRFDYFVFLKNYDQFLMNFIIFLDSFYDLISKLV